MVDFEIVWLYYGLGGIYMLQYERFEKIMDLLETQPTIRVADLVPVLGASESTIRRDIAQLDEEGRTGPLRVREKSQRGSGRRMETPCIGTGIKGDHRPHFSCEYHMGHSPQGR